MTGSQMNALDTSFVIALLRGETTCSIAMDQVSLPVVVVGELLFGALGARNGKEGVQHLERLLSRCRIISANKGTARAYAALRLQLKNQGTPIPENDIWIASIYLQNDLTLLTFDAHFQRVPGLRIDHG